MLTRSALLPAFLPLGLLVAASSCTTNRVALDDVIAIQPLETATPSSDKGFLQIEAAVITPGPQPLRIRLNGKYLVWELSPGDFEYAEMTPEPIDVGYHLGGSVGTQVPTGSYVVELVGRDGTVRATSDAGTINPVPAFPGHWSDAATSVVFVGDLEHVIARTVEPFPRDDDSTTDEITVMNVIDEPVAVEQCDVAIQSTQCTPIGTVAPGAESHFTLALAPRSTDSNHVLRLHPAGASSPYFDGVLLSYDRILNADFAHCQVEELFAVGSHLTYTSAARQETGGLLGFAETSCL